MYNVIVLEFGGSFWVDFFLNIQRQGPECLSFQNRKLLVDSLSLDWSREMHLNLELIHDFIRIIRIMNDVQVSQVHDPPLSKVQHDANKRFIWASKLGQKL